MDPQEFRKTVNSLVSLDLVKKSPEAVSLAINHYIKQGQRDRNHISACIELVGDIAENMQSTDETQAPDSSQEKASAIELEVKRDQLLAVFNPIVAQIRGQIFDSTDPPFTCNKDAVKWLEQRDAEQMRPSLSRMKISKEEQVRELRKHELWGAILENIAEYNRFSPTLMRIHQIACEIPYLKFPDSPEEEPEYRTIEVMDRIPDFAPHTNLASIPEGSPLALIEWLARAMVGQVPGEAEQTAFSNLASVAYCLVGIPPKLEIAKTRFEETFIGSDTSEPLGFRRLIITLHSPYVTYRKFRELHRQIQRDWRVEKTKRLTESDVKLIKITEEIFGGEPRYGQKGTTKLWKKVQQKCDQQKKEKKDWRSTRDKYWRAKERLKKL